MPGYNQHVIKIKLNQYLDLHKRPMSLVHGYCHGLTLLWLYKMAEGEQEWFYQTVKNILSCQSLADFTLYEKEIEKFISYIEWLQNSDEYEIGVNQLDIQSLTGLSCEFSMSYLFSSTEWKKVLSHMLESYKPVFISSPLHTIGIINNNNHIYFYDVNKSLISPEDICDKKILYSMIIKSLFPAEDVSLKRLPLEMFMLGNPFSKMLSSKAARRNKEKMYHSFIKSCKHLNRVGLFNTTNLHLACESGDAMEVELLLKHGADPNQSCRHNWTPLLLAAAKGYIDIARLLISYGADPGLTNLAGISPLQLATEARHVEMMKIISSSSLLAMT